MVFLVLIPSTTSLWPFIISVNNCSSLSSRLDRLPVLDILGLDMLELKIGPLFTMFFIPTLDNGFTMLFHHHQHRKLYPLRHEVLGLHWLRSLQKQLLLCL